METSFIRCFSCRDVVGGVLRKVEAKESCDHEYLGCFAYTTDMPYAFEHKKYFDTADQATCRAHCESCETPFYALQVLV